MRRIVVGGVVAVGLGCAGFSGSEAPDVADPDGGGSPPRVERTGEVVPARVAELAIDGDPDRCELRQHTLPGDGIVEVGELAVPCPAAAFFTWSDSRLVVGAEGAALLEVAGAEIEPPPTPVELAALDGGVLHVCGRVDAKVRRHGNDLEADHEGARLLGYMPAIGEEAQVAVHRVYDGKAWSKRSAEIVVKRIGDPPGLPPCHTMSDWPKGRTAHSAGPVWPAAEWARAVPDDEAALDTLKDGDWFVNASRTVAAQGQPGRGPYAAWLGGTWQLVHPGRDASGLWVLEDFLGVRDGSGGFRLVSRRDGSVAFERDPNTLAMPWPEGAPSTLALGGATPEAGAPEGPDAAGRYDDRRGAR